MISVINDIYVVQAPEYGIYQDIDPKTSKAFANQAAAQAWYDNFVTARASNDAATAAAEHARLAQLLVLTVSLNAARVSINTAITGTATLRDGNGATVPLNDVFAVPILDDTGKVAKIKAVQFTNGVANVSLTFDHSGYYHITEAEINRKMPEGMHIAFAVPLDIVVYE